MEELGFEDPDRSDNGKPSKEFRAHAKKLHGFIQAWKEGGRRLEEISRITKLPLELALARDVWPVYQRLLLERNSRPFADLLAYVVELFEIDAEFANRWANRWSYVCVDEFQDTNELQLRWLRHVCANTDNIYIIGDPDQAIYAWRNAKAEVMSAMLKDWPSMKSIVLKTNYRSSQPILDAANNIVD